MVEDDNLIQLPRDDGAGYCRLSAENCSLERSFEVTLIDCYSYHRFQPLLYQVATAAVTPRAGASPVRANYLAGPCVSKRLIRGNGSEFMIVELSECSPARGSVKTAGLTRA